MKDQLFTAFKKTTTTYNYFWFLSVLEFVQKGRFEIEKKELFAQMLTLAAPWTETNLSFKKNDQLPKLLEKVRVQKLKDENWGNSSKRYKLFLEAQNEKLKREIWKLDSNAPHRFLTPWLHKIEKESDVQFKKRIMENSQQTNVHAPYALFEDKIIIHTEWYDFFAKNNSSLKVATIAKLIDFLDKKENFKHKI